VPILDARSIVVFGNGLQLAGDEEARAAEIVSYFLVGLGLRVAGDRWAAAQSPKIGILSARAAATCRSSKLANSTI